MAAAGLVILMIAWVVLLFFTFRAPAPRLSQLFSFLLLVGVTIALGYLFAIRVLHFNPDPGRLFIARTVTQEKIIDLTQIVPGLPPDLDLIHRLDTDGDDEESTEEWLVLYRYDVATADDKVVGGPFGAAIYDTDLCRPPAIQSYELAPKNYDYLGQTWASAAVGNIIPYEDHLASGGLDRNEVLITGQTGPFVTDLNIFRKVGVEPNCLEIQAWRKANPGQIYPYAELLSYENIGSFRGNHHVERNGSTVTTVDRSPFERSQITIRRVYRPREGTYFEGDGVTLLPPVEYSLAFGAGEPDDIPEVYYPEKAVLAFYLNLGKDQGNLDKAKSYLSPDAQDIFDIKTDKFGLYMSRQDLARVLIWEIRYAADRQAEQLHENREVTITVVGVDKNGNIDYAHPCEVTWGIIGYPNPNAHPYGCEWRLDWYNSPCLGDEGK